MPEMAQSCPLDYPTRFAPDGDTFTQKPVVLDQQNSSFRHEKQSLLNLSSFAVPNLLFV
jgi:hypothetical protein